MPYTWTTSLSIGGKAKVEVISEMATPIAAIYSHCPSNYTSVRSSVNGSYDGSNLNYTSKDFSYVGANISTYNNTKNTPS